MSFQTKHPLIFFFKLKGNTLDTQYTKMGSFKYWIEIFSRTLYTLLYIIILDGIKVIICARKGVAMGTKIELVCA